jgi:hypothetical protein
MKGVKLTQQQRNTLDSTTFDGVQYYNPILDNNDEYFITQEEVNQTTNPDTMWVKELPLEDFQIRFISLI